MIYMDNAATTSVSPGVISAMKAYMEKEFANPAGTYDFAKKSFDAIESARSQIARTLKVLPSEIYFTSGGTESDNWAIKGIAEANRHKGKHIIISAIEHHAILNSAKTLARNGWDITVLPVDDEGRVDPNDVEKSIRKDTILVSVMTANNEIGTLEPIYEISNITHKHDVLFHTDAVQAFGHIPLDLSAMGCRYVDMLSASSHKFHGPKGVGFLFVRSGVNISPLMDGGEQENNMRAGTSNVPGIVGMAKAAEMACNSLMAQIRVCAMRDYMINRIENEIPGAKLNGSRKLRLPNNINFSFKSVDGRSLIMLLGMDGICVSGGSACSSGSLSPSHVLSSIHVPENIIHNSIRLTISESTTYKEADIVVDAIKRRIEDLSLLV